MMIDMDKTGKLITQLRKDTGLTQSDLSKELRVTPQAISKWENGLSLPDIVALLKLADFFKITTDEILRGELNTVLINETTHDAREIIEEDQKEAISLEDNLDSDEGSINSFDETGKVTIERNGKIYHFSTNGTGENTHQKIILKEKDKKHHYYSYDHTKKDEEDDETTLSIHQLIGMAPFMSEKSLLKVLNRLEEKEFPTDQLMAIVPFLPKERVKSIVDKLLKDKETKRVVALFPFLSSKDLEEVVKTRANDDPKLLLKAAPFMNEDSLLKMLRKGDGKIELENLSPFAPFLSEKVISELVLASFSEENIKLVEKMLPFLSQGTIDQLLERSEDLGISDKFITKSLPFISKKSISAILEGNFISGEKLGGLSNLAPFLDNEQMQMVLKQIRDGKLPRKALTIIAPFLDTEILDRLVDESMEG